MERQSSTADDAPAERRSAPGRAEWPADQGPRFVAGLLVGLGGLSLVAMLASLIGGCALEEMPSEAWLGYSGGVGLALLAFGTALYVQIEVLRVLRRLADGMAKRSRSEETRAPRSDK